MTTETIYDKPLSVTPGVRSEGAGSGLTSATAELLTIFDRLEREVDADRYGMEVHSPARRMRVVRGGD